MAAPNCAQATLTTTFSLALDSSLLSSNYGTSYNKICIQNPTNSVVELKIGNSTTARSFWVAPKLSVIYDNFAMGSGQIYARLASGTGNVIFTIW